MDPISVLESLVYHPGDGPRDEDAMTAPQLLRSGQAECLLYAVDGSLWLVTVTAV